VDKRTVLRIVGTALLVLLGCTVSRAQNTTVSATIVDPNGNAYALGTVSAQTVVSTGQSSTSTTPVGLNAAGVFSISLPSTRTYVFTICGSPVQLGPRANPTPTQLCFTSPPIFITGGSQNVTSAVGTPAILGPAINSISGNAATATSLLNTPSQCGAGNIATGVTATGNANCTPPIAAAGSIQCNVAGLLGACPDITDVGTVVTSTATNTVTNALSSTTGAFSGAVTVGGNTTIAGVLTQNNDSKFKGPNPWVDITNFGARSVNPNIAPAQAGVTATCTSGVAQVTINTASTFQNGDGVAIDNCGATNTMPTPAAPSVQPVLMAGPMGSEDIVNALPGATTYSYTIEEVDKLGARTATSPTGSTTVGLPTLGTINFSVSNSSLSGTTGTVNTVAATDLVPRALVYFNSNVNGGDSYLVGTTPSSTQFTYLQAGSSALGSNAQLSGSLSYTVCNHLTLPAHSATGFQYVIRDGGGNFIGMSRPVELFFDDCGATIRGSIARPREIPATGPVTATNDPLVTTIASGAGTTTLTLANAPTQTIAGQTILFDNASAVKAAVLAAGSGVPIYIPSSAASTYYVINSYLDLTGTLGVNIRQSGAVQLNEPIALPSNTRWVGNEGSGVIASQAFANNQYRDVRGTNRFPLVYITDSGFDIEGLSFSGLKDSALLVLVDSSNFNGRFKDCVFSFAASSGTVDYMSTGLMIRGLKNIFIENVLLNSLMSNNLAMGPWAGGLVVKGSTNHAEPGGQLKIKGMFTVAKAIAVDYTVSTSDMQGTIDGLYTQGSRTPLVQVSQTAAFTLPLTWTFKDVEVDTSSNAAFANLTASGFSTVTFENYSGASGGYRGPSISGNPIVTVIGGCCNNPPINTGTVNSFNGGALPSPKGYNFSDFIVNVGGGGTFQHSFTTKPAGPILTVLAGGTLSVGSHPYTYQFYDINGNSGPLSNTINATTTSGNQTVQVQAGTPPLGAIGFYVYEGARGRINLGSGGSGCGFNITGGLVISDNGGVQCGQSAFLSGGAGDAGVRNQNVFAPSYTVIDPNNTGWLIGTAVPKPLTNNRTVSFLDQSGHFVLTGNFQSAFDNFNRANGALGANWTVVSGALNVSGNTVLGTNGAAQNMSAYTAVSFTADQYAFLTLAAQGAQVLNVQVRASSTLVTAYECSLTTTTLGISKEVNGSFTSITTTGVTAAVGDSVYCQVQGSTITAIHIPATGATTTISTTDSAITTGSPGIRVFGNTVTAGDNFAAGSLHALGHLDLEQPFTQPQHFLAGISVGSSTGQNLNAVQGNSGKIQQASNTAFVSGNVVKFDANGNTVDSGIPAVGNLSSTAYLTSNYTNATTTMSNVTGLSFAVAANTKYKIRCDLDYQTSATTADIQLQWTGPASPTFVTSDMVTEVTGSSLSASVVTAFSTPMTETGTPTINTNFPLSLTMTLSNGVNSGTIQLQAAATGVGTVTIIPGSCSMQP
jgi:hypothetical protein